jgi:hypothetical protein
MLCAVVAVLLAQSARAHVERYRSFLSAANENPPVPPEVSMGVGTSLVTFDLDLFTMRVETSFSDLAGTTTQANIHCCIDPPGNVGVATETPSFTGFPLGVMAGSMDTTFDMSLATSHTAPFLTANGGSTSNAFQALYEGIRDGRAYFNIHTSVRGGW